VKGRLKTLTVLIGACVQLARADALYHEAHRPQFHFSPPQQWMNDPNGLVYDQGEYHLFYQHNPYSNKWGPMHWGHAVGSDLVHWDNLPIALYPDRNGTIFSGSAVLDVANTSGFGRRAKPPLVAIYTYHDHLREHLGETGFQSQGLAYSLDRGRNWVKYAGNPVLTSPAIRDFRDPKVFWYVPERKWVMALAVADHIAFYSSPDLKHWRHESDFGKEWGSHAGVWECPDLIRATVQGTRASRYVLLVSIGRGGPSGGSATQYFVGDFDGHRFTLDPALQLKLKADTSGTPAIQAQDDRALWLDYGADDYAGSTWSGGAPGDARQLFIGWMNNWVYANEVPTERWRSAMTVPRELGLLQTERGLEVHSTPVRELDSLRRESLPIAARSSAGTIDLTGLAGAKGDLLELDLDLDLRSADTVELRFANASGESTVFRVNRPKGRYELDRSASGTVSFNAAFGDLQVAPIRGSAQGLKLQLYMDHSSLEIFLNEGETVFTSLVFPSVPYNLISLKSDREIELKAGTVYELQSIWK